MQTGKFRPLAILILGVLTMAGGVVLVVAYVMEAVYGTSGDPDRSLLFWYLPFLFMGIMVLVTGLIMGSWGMIRLRRLRRAMQEQPLPDEGNE